MAARQRPGQARSRQCGRGGRPALVMQKRKGAGWRWPAISVPRKPTPSPVERGFKGVALAAAAVELVARQHGLVAAVDLPVDGEQQLARRLPVEPGAVVAPVHAGDLLRDRETA